MRANRHQMFMAMARAAATRSTCYRLSVGAVVVRDHNVVSIGYNGAPSGQPHCTGNGCSYFASTGCRVLHAEANALEKLPFGQIRGFDLYVTHSPCATCAALIAGTTYPIQNVYYETPYRDPSPVQSLLTAGVWVFQVLPSGFVVNCATGELVV